MPTFLNSTVAFIEQCKDILNNGDDVNSRNSMTKELTGVHIELLRPMERCYLLPKRNDNIFHKIAETLWVIAGRDDIKWLSYYLPRAQDYSDDGETWRAAYGKRLRHYQQVDQVAECARLMNSDRYTRRAVMSIFDPSIDFYDSKDVPCNNWIHWLIRDTMQEFDPAVAKLNMYVAQRSSDILWGFSGINTFEWSVLQMMMAHWCGVTPGTMTYSLSSLHMYEPHFKRAQSIIDAWKRVTVYDYDVKSADGFNTPLSDIDGALDKFFKCEAELRFLREIDYSHFDPFLKNCMQMLEIFINIQVPNEDYIVKLLNELPDNDFKLAAINYCERKFGVRIINRVNMAEHMTNAYSAVYGEAG